MLTMWFKHDALKTLAVHDFQLMQIHFNHCFGRLLMANLRNGINAIQFFMILEALRHIISKHLDATINVPSSTYAISVMGY